MMIPILLVACGIGVGEAYLNSPKKRSVNMDDHQLYVVPESQYEYVAWGGEEDADGFVEYRQKRAVELVSGCRVWAVTSQKGDAVLRARVKC